MAMVQVGRGYYDDGQATPARTPEPIVSPGAPIGGPVSGGSNDLEAQARALYGGAWDADASQDFANRTAQGQSPDDLLKHTAEDYKRRFPSQPSGGGGRASSPAVFDDPSSAQLEGIAKAQMGEVRSNPALNDLMAFLEKEFTRLSTNPGFSTEENAMLHTQALEPIEQRRQASNTRAVERAGARGFLPTSGLTYLTEAPQGGVESLDTSYDRMRTGADRDLALANVNQRRADLNQAVQVGQLRGLDIPKSQRSEELNLSRLLYQMPRDALSDLLAVLGASPSSSELYNQSAQTAQQSYQNQLREDERNAALMQEIGGLLSGLFK